MSALARSGVVKTETMTQDDAEKAVDDDKVAAALVIPAGFSAALAAGRPAELTLVSIAGSTGAQTVQTEVTALAGAAGGRRARGPGGRGGGRHARRQHPVGSEQALEDAALLMARPLAAQALADPVATVKVVEAGTAAGQIPNGFVLSSPGMLVNFILFSLLTAGIALIQERRNFTLLRLMTTRVRRWELIAGKAAGMFALTFVQQIILIGAGQLLFGVDYLRDPAALLADDGRALAVRLDARPAARRRCSPASRRWWPPP